MPHYFITLPADSPNPGRWTREKAEPICSKHKATLDYLWFDSRDAPSVAYMLLKDGDAGGLKQDLHATQVIELYEP